MSDPLIMESKTMEDRIKNIENKIDSIHEAILGDQYDPDKGIMPRLKSAEKYIDRDKKLKWVGAGIVGAVGYLGANVKEWLVHIFSNPPQH